jgi:Cdc6-like AAA superfamily ATPase
VTTADDGRWARYAEVAQVFTPGAPIDSLALFAGRLEQAKDVINAVSQTGQHVILYGERGVGKTSLANVLREIFADRLQTAVQAVRINCNTGDGFADIWRNVFRELDLPDPYVQAPEDVRYALRAVEGKTLVIIDELDRLAPDDTDETLPLLADTVKTLSDHPSQTTLALVGVADHVEELIKDHRSIERALVQVKMPRMSEGELADIVSKGCDRLEMEALPEARMRIVSLSAGLPHYTHLLSLHAGQRAVMDSRDLITEADVAIAIGLAVDKAQHSIASAYQRATRSVHKESLYPQVLLACALAEKDELGYFTSGDVRNPMSLIMGRPYDIPSYARHLNQFASAARGDVLQKRGTERNYFYRFENPLLQPYIILNGLSRQLIAREDLDKLLDRGEIVTAEEAFDQLTGESGEPSQPDS